MPDRWEGQSPGASGPGDPGYDGEVTLGDDGAVAGPESFVDPSGLGGELDGAVPASALGEPAEGRGGDREPGEADEDLEGDVADDLPGGGTS